MNKYYESQHKCKVVEVNMEDEELVKLFNPTLKRKEIILFFLIVVVNELTWIVSNIRLDMCVRGRWRVKVRKGLLWLQNLTNQHSVQIVLHNFFSLYYFHYYSGILIDLLLKKRWRIQIDIKPRTWISLKRASATPQSK